MTISMDMKKKMISDDLRDETDNDVINKIVLLLIESRKKREE